jgi:nitrite reductase (NADH) large subunit
MRIVIIGLGVAGQTAAETIRKADPTAEILIISSEPYGYYSRIYLPHYIAEEKTLDQLILRKLDWYQTNNISVLLDTTVTKINPAEHTIEVEGESSPITYDKLILATGSRARKLPFGNPDVKGMYTLRNVENADEIKQDIRDRHVKKAFIIGGGLLGIELGYHLLELKLDVTICEILPYLLPRQLDKGTSAILQKYLESKGLQVVCGKPVKKVVGESHVTGVEMEDGTIYHTDMVFQQMGIIPNLEIAKAAGLKTDKAIIVNDKMQTSNPDIYAAGDCIQFGQSIWGIIPASLEQGKIAANAVLGKLQAPYTGTVWNTRLKIAGIQLSCFGSPPSPDNKEEMVMERTDMENFLCRKVILWKDEMKGAILMGGGDEQFFMKNVGKKIDKAEIERKLFEQK